MRKQTLNTALLLLGLLCLGLFAVRPHSALAANPTNINFQGKVVNANGTNVADGTYSFVFRVYNTSSPTMTTSCTTTATCAWQETQASVSVTSGVFQVELGSACALTSSSCNNSAFVAANGGAINFSTNNALYLTLQFAGDTSGANGGFMSPLIHLTSVPYAFYADNAGTLSGLAAGNFVQLAQGIQTDASSANASIAINKTGSTANILTFQQTGVSVFTISNTGSALFKPYTASDSTTAFQVQNSGGTQLLNVDSTNSRIAVDASYTGMSTSFGTVTVVDGGGGALTNTTQYYYKITAVDSAGGETTASSEGTLGTGHTALSVSWTAIPGAVGYKIYRSAVSGSETYLSSVSTNTFLDGGLAATVAGTPPSTNTAYILTSNTSKDSKLSLTVGGNGTPTGQLYVSGTALQVVGHTDNDGTFTTPVDVAIKGKYAYVLDDSNVTLNAYDLSNPVVPKLLYATSSHLSNPEKIAVQGDYGYITDTGTDQFITYNITNAAWVSTLSGFSSIQSVAVQGQYAFVGDNIGFHVVDISNPAAPKKVGVVSGAGAPFEISIQGHYAYAVVGGSLKVFDISNPLAPVEKSTTAVISATNLQVNGRYAYVASQTNNSLKVYDISNAAAAPVLVGTDSTSLTGVHSVSVQGRYVYVANTSSLAIIDVSNPAAPTTISTLSSGVSTPKNLKVGGRFAYAINSNQLYTYDVGGAYVQQLEAGGAQLNSLSVTGNGSVLGGFDISGGLQVAQSLQVSGSFGLIGGATIQGSTVLTGGANQLATPSAPTVTPQGTGGAQRWDYVITAFNSSGGETPGSTAGTTAGGNASLDSGNFNRITWSAVSGATGYKIYRTYATGGVPVTTGLVGSTTSTTFDDIGNDASLSTSAPTINTTSQLTVEGGVLLQQAASLTSGQTQLSQIFTNGSSTGGTVQGLSQTITVSNTSSATTTNGINIALTDATTLVNTSNGVSATLTDNGASGAKTNKAVVGTAGGSNASAVNYGGYFSLSGGSSSSAALFATNGTATGNIFQLQDGTSTVKNVVTVANEGAATFANRTDSTAALQVQNANGTALLNVDTASNNANNLVTNPSIESAISGNWAKRSTSETTFIQDSNKAFSGANSLKVITSATAGDGAKQNATLTNGTTYTACFYALLDSPATNLFASGQGLQVGYAFNGSDITTLTSQTFTPVSSGWTRFCYTFLQNQTNAGTPYIFIKQTDNVVAHTFWIDAVTVQTDTNADSNYREGKLSVATIVTTPIIIQNTSNSSTVFQIQNSGGSSIISADTTTTNVISNPGFETNTTGWSAQGAGTTIVRDTSTAQTGFASLKITTGTAVDSGALFSLNPVVTKASTTYIVVFNAKLKSGDPAFTDLIVRYSPDNSATADCNISAMNSQTVVSGGWTHYTCQFSSATATSTSGYLLIKDTAGVAHNFWIDGVRVEAGTATTSYGAGKINFNATINSPLYLQNTSDSNTALQLQNAAGALLLVADTVNFNLKIYDSTNANYASISATSNSATFQSNTGTTNVGNGAGAININAGASSAVTITGHAASVWSTDTGGSLTVQGGSTLSLLSTTSSGITIDSGTTGAITVGALNNTNAKNVSVGNNNAGSTIDIDAGTGATGIEIGNTNTAHGIQIGTNATAANVVAIGAANASSTLTLDAGTAATGIQIGNSTSAHGIQIGAGGTAAGNAQSVTIGSLTTSTNSKVVLQGGGIANSSGAAGVFIGSPTADTSLVPFQLDSDSNFSSDETNGTNCTATVNQGALYYNTTSNAIRGCINGGWEDMVSTASLGLQLFGVVPDSSSGNDVGDLAGVTALINGPCKVAEGATTSTVSWKSCIAFSGGRKVIVTAGTAVTSAGTSATVLWQHLCLTAASNQPALSAIGTETANLATVSMTGVSNPILCLADIKVTNGSAVITGIYNTATYTTTTKEFATDITNGAALGHLVVNGTTTPGSVTPGVTLQGTNVVGVIVATTGTTSTSVINVVVAINGPGWVKAITETGNAVGNTIQETATTGYAGAFTTAVFTSTSAAYQILGIARTAWTSACAINSLGCNSAVLTNIAPR